MTSYIPLWGFIILMVSTPGPANLLLMSAGARWGYRRSLPFLSGLVVGKLALNVAMALGFMAVLLNSPRVLTTLSWVSAGYMAYLALRQWTPAKETSEPANSLGFLQGLVVHPLSPKTWMMTTLAFSQFAPTFPTEIERLAVVPLVLEARGLDVTPAMIDKLRAAGDNRSADILEVIYATKSAMCESAAAGSLSPAPAAAWSRLRRGPTLSAPTSRAP